MDSRSKAILAHITIIGWLIVLLINNESKDQMASFYLRQTLILHILFMIVSWIPVVGWMVWIVAFAFWVLSLVYAIKSEQKLIPFGEHFQRWFAAL
ncbi:MAG: hypothetical protein KBA02_06105 [Paludibacteraceae bacterium]|nr:hypothetical protein [Paludibacteraceae bacterium]